MITRIPAKLLFLTLGLTMSSFSTVAHAGDFQMQDLRTVTFDSVRSRVDGKLVDYDRDGFDDVMYLSSNRLVVYSVELDSLLWVLKGDNFIGAVVDDLDGDGFFDAAVLRCDDSLFVAFNGDIVLTGIRSLPFYYGISNYGQPCSPADLSVRDLGSDGVPDLVVSRPAKCYRIYCGAMVDFTESGQLMSFRLPDFEETHFFEQSNCYPPVWSDDRMRSGDLDGDGVPETISFGRRSQGLCGWETESGIPGELMAHDVNIYNQIGQRIGGFVQDYGLDVAVGDLDPLLPGDELIFSGPRELSGEEMPLGWTGKFVYAFDLNNGALKLRWSMALTGPSQHLLLHPALPYLVALEFPSESRWQLLNGADGVETGEIRGLVPNLPTLGGRFSQAADTGLQIVQLTSDGIVLYGPAIPTAIEDDSQTGLPGGFVLYQNYPNPFNPLTEIAFVLSEAGVVTLEVFNIAGQRVALPLQKYLTAGEHRTVWDGMGFASGVYLYRLTLGEYSQTRKMMLLK